MGENFLHDTVEDATKSTKSNNKGVKIGHKAVECRLTRNPAASPVADQIEARRKARGEKLDTPVTIDELRAAGI